MTLKQQSAYDDGARQAVNVLRTLGLRQALADVTLFARYDRVPAAYTAGYTDAVLEAVQG